MTYHLFTLKPTTALKEHPCIWCNHRVLLRSRYIREHSIYDGWFQNFAWHEACRKDAEKCFDDGDNEFTSDNEMPFFELYKLELNDG